MPHKNGHVAGIVPVDGLEEFLHGRVDPGRVAVIAEKPRAGFLRIRAVRFKAHGGETAVSRDEGRDSLPDEGLQILQRLFLDGEPVIMGMGVKKAGRNAETAQVDDLVRLHGKAGLHIDNSLTIDQDVTDKRVGAGPVIDFSVFE